MTFSPKGEYCELMNADAPQEPDSNNEDVSTGDIEQVVIASIVDLLVEKGIFTRDELAERINFRKG